MPVSCAPRILVVLAVILQVSCATNRTPRSHTAPLLPGMKAHDDPLSVQSAVNPAESVPVPETQEAALDHFDEPQVPAERLDEDEEEIELRPKKNIGKNSPIPHEFNEDVAEWIRYFSQQDRERFQRFLDRGEPYREAVENILEENKVPADLYYLGLIESGFNFRAKSKVKAVGVWQFMRPTGKMYGLDSDAYIDERKDPIRATEAAARYLRDLYREFKSWYLAMAAYNAGPGRIRGCIRKANTDDFWELVERRKLPQETMDYIPKYLAARYIGENPDLFAFYINEEKKYPDVQLVKIPSPVKFETIEKVVGIPSGTLSFVNPHYLKSFSHPSKKTDEIWVPEKYADSVERNYASLAKMTVFVPVEKTRVIRPRAEKIQVYIVKKGDTLKSIARKKGMSVAYLREVNALSKNARMIPGQKLKLSATRYRQKRSHPRKMSRKKKG